MSSACDAKCILCVDAGVGMSCMNRLNNVVKRTEPCTTAFKKCIMFDDFSLYCM
jgi:hypothetical protein